MTTQFKDEYAKLGIEAPKTTDLVEKAGIIYDAACKKLGLDPVDLPDVSRVREKYRASQLAFHKLEVVRDAIAEDREADWNNSDEYKYFAWWRMNKPGFRLFDFDFGWAVSNSCAGSRLCTFSEEGQEFFAKECIALWADFMGAKLPITQGG